MGNERHDMRPYGCYSAVYPHKHSAMCYDVNSVFVTNITLQITLIHQMFQTFL